MHMMGLQLSGDAVWLLADAGQKMPLSIVISGLSQLSGPSDTPRLAGIIILYGFWLHFCIVRTECYGKRAVSFEFCTVCCRLSSRSADCPKSIENLQ